MAVIGIDLGITNTRVARCVDGVAGIVYLEGDAALPSVVGLQANGKIAVGRTAKNNQAKFPHNTVVEVKRRMGEDADVMLGQKACKPQDISAMILSKIKELAEAELGESVTGAVISCPAYFRDNARQATMQAGEIAGINVLRIINEPTAAAYAYGVMQATDDVDMEKLYVVYDLGGGTFDVTVIKSVGGTLEVIGTGGDPHLGGGNFDDRIVDWMLGSLRETHPQFVASLNDEAMAALKMRLKSSAEKGKIALCDSQDANPAYAFNLPGIGTYDTKPVNFTKTLTMPEFEALIDDLMQNSLKWVDVALEVPTQKLKYTEADITAILLVGGSTQVPLVRRIVEQRFPGTTVRGQECGINPNEIVAMGASIVASEIDPDSDEVKVTPLVDVTGHTLSLEYLDGELGVVRRVPIIPKETPVPCSAELAVTVPAARAHFEVTVYQEGDGSPDQTQVTKIGELTITIAPVSQPTPVAIGLTLDANGLLIAHATDMLSGRRVDCQICYSDTAQLSPDDLKRRQAELEAQLNVVIGQTASGKGRRLDENVQFTVYRPRVVRPMEWVPMLAFAHLLERRPDAPAGTPDPLEVVRHQAQRLLDDRAREYQPMTADSQQAIPEAAELAFVPSMQGVEFNPPLFALQWQEDVHRAEFRLRAAEHLDGQTVRGAMTVYLGPLRIASINLSIGVDSNHERRESQEDTERATTRPYRKVFASYSHSDALIVEQVEKWAGFWGNRFLRDANDLRRGRVWSEELERMIREADEFLLFWSWSSMRSRFVRQEWEYALSLGRIGFVCPGYWEEPMPEDPPDLPPEELARLHFDRLPVGTTDAQQGGGNAPDRIAGGGPHVSVEMAFLPPILLVAILAMLQFGLAFRDMAVLKRASDAGARAAAAGDGLVNIGARILDSAKPLNGPGFSYDLTYRTWDGSQWSARHSLRDRSERDALNAAPRGAQIRVRCQYRHRLWPIFAKLHPDGIPLSAETVATRE